MTATSKDSREDNERDQPLPAVMVAEKSILSGVKKAVLSNLGSRDGTLAAHDVNF